MSGERVLVTGGSGFVGAHCIVSLLAAGYRVRTTVRSLAREAEVRAMLKAGGAEAGEALSFAAADLTSDAGWPEAVAGCDFVLHVASPFPPGAPKHEDELIVPAREGASARAPRRAGGGREARGVDLVLRRHRLRPRADEPALHRGRLERRERPSERLREIQDPRGARGLGLGRRAREALELSVVNPVGILGPVLGPDLSTSILIVQRLMDGAMPGCPRLSFGLVDVRDVADLHLRAMTHPAARGERFLAVAGSFVSMQEIAKVLKARLGEAARRVPTRTLPNWLVRLVGLFDPAVGTIAPELGKVKNATNEKARRVLGWQPRSSEDAIVATAESLLRFGLLRSSGAAG